MNKEKKEVLLMSVGFDPTEVRQSNESGELFRISYDSNFDNEVCLKLYRIRNGIACLASDFINITFTQMDELMSLFTEMKEELKKEGKL